MSQSSDAQTFPFRNVDPSNRRRSQKVRPLDSSSFLMNEFLNLSWGSNSPWEVHIRNRLWGQSVSLVPETINKPPKDRVLTIAFIDNFIESDCRLEELCSGSVHIKTWRRKTQDLNHPSTNRSIPASIGTCLRSMRVITENEKKIRLTFIAQPVIEIPHRFPTITPLAPTLYEYDRWIAQMKENLNNKADDHVGINFPRLSQYN
jgi:hypothetical protein